MSEFQVIQPDSEAPASPPAPSVLTDLRKTVYSFLFPPSLSKKLLDESLNLFSNLEMLDTDVKQSLRPEVTFYMEQLTALDVFMGRVKNISRWLVLFVGGISWLFSFRVTQSWFNVQPPPLTVGSGGILFILTIICYALLMLLFILPNFIKVVDSVKTLFIWHVVLSLVYMIFVLILLLGNNFDAPGILPYLSYIILIALIGNLIFEFFYFFVVTFFVVFGPLALEKWQAARYPLATMIYQLISVLRSLEQSKQRSTIDLRVRRKQLAAIEIASRCLELFLPRQLPGGDIVTDAWLKEAMQEAANALREKKRWILTPKADTYGYLTRSLADMLICVISGDWDRLERVKYAQLAHSHLWLTRILHTTRLIIEATLPFLIGLVVVVFHPLSNLFPIPESIEGYLIIGPLLWGVITIVEALDPNFNDKVDTIKNVLSLLPSKE